MCKIDLFLIAKKEKTKGILRPRKVRDKGIPLPLVTFFLVPEDFLVNNLRPNGKPEILSLSLDQVLLQYPIYFADHGS